LTDMNIDVPDYKGLPTIPVTYVPARNIIFLSYAVGYAEVVDAEAIFIGVNAVITAAIRIAGRNLSRLFKKQ